MPIQTDSCNTGSCFELLQNRILRILLAPICPEVFMAEHLKLRCWGRIRTNRCWPNSCRRDVQKDAWDTLCGYLTRGLAVWHDERHPKHHPQVKSTPVHLTLMYVDRFIKPPFGLKTPSPYGKSLTVLTLSGRSCSSKVAAKFANSSMPGSVVPENNTFRVIYNKLLRSVGCSDFSSSHLLAISVVRWSLDESGLCGVLIVRLWRRDWQPNDQALVGQAKEWMVLVLGVDGILCPWSLWGVDFCSVAVLGSARVALHLVTKCVLL